MFDSEGDENDYFEHGRRINNNNVASDTTQRLRPKERSKNRNAGHT